MRELLMRVRRRASFANVTSAAALFVALGGTSYAAISIPANSVGADQIRTGAVGSKEIKTGAVNTAEIHTGGVAKAEIRTGGVGASELHTDAVRTPEIKAGAVKSDELDAGAVSAGKIAKDAVSSDEIKDGSVDAADVNDATRQAFAGFRASVTKGGGAVAGNATSAAKTAGGTYTVDFGKDVSGCVATATPAAVKNTAGGMDAPEAGATVNVAPGATNTSVVVTTFNNTNAASDEPFNLTLAC
jgi:hypothetical protein